MRIASLVLAVLALAGCAPSERDRVGESVETFLHAFARGDTKTACARLVPEVRMAFKEGCEAGLKKETDALSAAERERLSELDVRDVRIKGDRANAWLESQGGEPGTLRRIDGDTARASVAMGGDAGTRHTLRRVDGDWLLDVSPTEG